LSSGELGFSSSDESGSEYLLRRSICGECESVSVVVNVLIEQEKERVSGIEGRRIIAEYE
jgi:hypothetical protein